MLLGGPARHVGANLGDQSQGVVGPDPIDLREVDATSAGTAAVRTSKRGSLRWRLSETRGRGRRERARGAVASRCSCGPRSPRRTPPVGVGQTRTARGVCREHKDMLRLIVPGQRRDDLRLRCPTARVPMPGEGAGSVWPATMSRTMRKPVSPGDITHDQRQLQVHLDQRLLHPLDAAPPCLNQRLAMAQIRAQGHDPRRRPEAAAQQARRCAAPAAIRNPRHHSSARDILDVTRVDEEHVEARGLRESRRAESNRPRSLPSPRS